MKITYQEYQNALNVIELYQKQINERFEILKSNLKQGINVEEEDLRLMQSLTLDSSIRDLLFNYQGSKSRGTGSRIYTALDRCSCIDPYYIKIKDLSNISISDLKKTKDVGVVILSHFLKICSFYGITPKE